MYGKTFTLDVELFETIENVKANIQDKEGHPIDDERLLWYYPNRKDGMGSLKTFEDARTLSE